MVLISFVLCFVCFHQIRTSVWANVTNATSTHGAPTLRAHIGVSVKRVILATVPRVKNEVNLMCGATMNRLTD